MVSIEQLKDKLHEEEMKGITAKVAEQTKKNRDNRIAREQMLSGPTEYIDLLRKAKIPINQTDIKEAVSPTKSKVLEICDKGERLVEAHAEGHMHSLYLRVAMFSFLFFTYMWL